MAEFAERLFEGPLPWAKVRQGHKLLRLGETLYGQSAWTPLAARASGRWTLLTVRRVERILVQALEEETHVPGSGPCRCRPLDVSPGQATSSLKPATITACHTA